MALSLTSSKTTAKSFGRSCLMPLTQRNGAVVELFFCLLMANGQTRGFFSFEAYQEQSTHMPQRGYPLRINAGGPPLTDWDATTLVV